MGFFDFISDGASALWHGASSVVSDVGSAIGDAASGAYHFAADAATSIYDAGVSVADTASEYIHRGEGAVMGGVHWVEDEVGAGTHALAGYVKGVPVLGALAEGAADATTFLTQVGGGIVGGATTLAGGAADAVLHPIDTALGLEAMAEHVPVFGDGLKLGHGLIDVATGDASLSDVIDRSLNREQSLQEDLAYWDRIGSGLLRPYKESAAEGRYGEIVGRTAFDIATLLSGAGEAEGAAAASEGAEAARAVEGAEAARVAEGVEATRASDAGELGRAGGSSDIVSAGPKDGWPRYHSVYDDGVLVPKGSEPKRLPTGRDPAAEGAHTRLRYDRLSPSRSGRGQGRIYQGREYDSAGRPLRDIDFTSPTYPSGRPRPDHLPPPHEHAWVPNDPENPRAGYRRDKHSVPFVVPGDVR